jgi:hypothetical protein
MALFAVQRAKVATMAGRNGAAATPMPLETMPVALLPEPATIQC